jgi:hypothetical protein
MTIYKLEINSKLLDFEILRELRKQLELWKKFNALDDFDVIIDEKKTIEQQKNIQCPMCKYKFKGG